VGRPQFRGNHLEAVSLLFHSVLLRRENDFDVRTRSSRVQFHGRRLQLPLSCSLSACVTWNRARRGEVSPTTHNNTHSKEPYERSAHAVAKSCIWHIKSILSVIFSLLPLPFFTMNNQSQERDIVEDTPQYRSVMIGGPLSAPPMPRSFASTSPFKAAPQTKKATQQRSSDAAVWSVAELPSLPAAYFLERSNVYVDGEAQEIADRISDCLRKQSIAATCDAEDKVRITWRLGSSFEGWEEELTQSLLFNRTCSWLKLVSA